VPRRKKQEKKPKLPEQKKPLRPNVQYWEDPVYRYVSGRYKTAQAAGNHAEVALFAEFMQKIVGKSLPDEVYFRLDTERKAFQQQQKKERKKGREVNALKQRQVTEPRSAINVAELKRRVFNPQTSSQNMIKALEAMPTDERKKTIRSLTSFLKSKIAKYLQSRGY